ncbi:MAG: amidohydrolase family protein [Gammaproteobacteria bacterium]|nr:amidohydrolase family protein [Gammaproteobacteria bacterium]MCP5201856.1 amidohydrolase family protein [Gammaproteobacteria bacterium]
MILLEPAATNRYGGWREDWLAATDEPVLEPDLPIVDAHHHLWHLNANRYLLDEWLGDVASGHAVRASVFVQCGAFYRGHGPDTLRPVGETEFVNGVAAMTASGAYGDHLACAGIVGFADLTLGEAVEDVLTAHLAAGGGRFRGIRHAAAWDAAEAVHNSSSNPPPGLYRDPTFRRGFARLAALGLSFDAWLYQFQLADLLDLARAFPAATIVVDHVGGIVGIGPYAGRHAEFFPAWRAAMRELAGCANVQVKLGGLGMKLGGFGFETGARAPGSDALAERWRPYVETCIEAFGAERCLFESNFPVDKHACSYRVLWNAFKRLAAGASAAEKAALFHDTAARVYRLELPQAG